MQRLLRNVIAMNEILRDHEHVSVRLVLTPDKLVIDEAQRTFTYLSLYGFLTDAVIANRVLPAEVDGYFGAVARAPGQAARGGRELVRARPGADARRSSPRRSSAPRCSTALGEELFDGVDPAAVLHDSITQELVVDAEHAQLRLELPFARKGEIGVTKVGLELVIRVGGHKRTLALPPALGDYRPNGATFEDGALRVTFDARDVTADA